MKYVFYRVLMLVSLLLGLGYLSFRALYTLNPDYFWFSLLFLLAEVHGFLALCFFFFDVWRPVRPQPIPAPAGLSVDVFIPTYNEDVELLRKTIIGAVTMPYLHTTYVLDDGNREEVRRLAAELGAEYIARKDHAHAKAGNINHALSITRGDFVAVFDADHVPQPDFLDKTLGFFTDERVAFVQTPQYFYNLDAFEEQADLDHDDFWEQQGLFFHQIQPGKQRWNASFFCGTCAVIRRAALEEVGGIATETITEDIHTSLLLHAKGWKSIYLDRHLATGLAPDDVFSYYKQRTRWSLGNMRVMFIQNPLFTRGLTLPQRISYFSSMFSWTVGLQKILYYITPALMLLTPIIPIRRFFPDLVAIYFVYLFVQLAVYKLVTQGRGRIFEEEVFSMLNFWLLVKSFFRALMGLGVTKFVVTRKSGQSERLPLRMVLPQALIFIFSFSGLLWGLFRLLYEVRHDPLSIGFGMFWAAYICGLSGYVIVRALMRFHREGQYRMPSSVPVLYRRADEDGEALNGAAFTFDLNEQGMTLVAYESLPLDRPTPGRLVLDTIEVDVVFQPLYIHRALADEAAGIHAYGARFIECDPVSLDLLSLYMMNRAVPELIGTIYSQAHEQWRWSRLIPLLRLRTRRPEWLGAPVLIHAEESTGPTAGKLVRIQEGDRLTVSLREPAETGARRRIELLSRKGAIRTDAMIIDVKPVESEELTVWLWDIQLLGMNEPARGTLNRLKKGGP